MTKSEITHFPQYRRYLNGHSYFKILSATEFEEIKIVGKRAMKHHVVAKQYPEKVFIQDLLYHYEKMATVISEEEYRKMDRSKD
jgi:hypothetical protein